MVLLVGRQTCDLQVAGSSPGWTPLRSGLGQATYMVPLCASVITKYTLVPAKGVISLDVKVAAGLVKVTASYHRVID